MTDPHKSNLDEDTHKNADRQIDKTDRRIIKDIQINRETA